MIEYLALSSNLSGSLPLKAVGNAETTQRHTTLCIDIFGPLKQRSQVGFMSWLIGDNAASYESIGQMFQDAIEDDDIHQVILNIDSPGGEVQGAFDLSDLIYNARGTKPIIAIANENALSAAYLIASAADKLYLSRTAQVGSIGVLAVHADQSKMEEKVGIKFTEIYAGERKTDFSPHGPLSKEAFQEAQQKVNSTYSLFVQTVARNRNISEGVVRATEAAIYSGQDAVKMGLADNIQTFNQLLRGETMPLKEELSTLLQGKKPEEITEAMKAQGFIPTDSNPPDHSKEIMAIAELAGVTDLSFVMGLVNEGIEPEEARQKILEAKADQSKMQIFSTVSPTGTGEQNVLLMDAAKRAKQE